MAGSQKAAWTSGSALRALERAEGIARLETRGRIILSRLGGVSARLLDERRHRREGGLAFAEADERQAH